MVGLNMRSYILIWFLVTVTFAHQNNPAWKGNTEYTYEVQARSLAGIGGISDEFTGIVLRAKLIVQPFGSDRLRCQVNQPEYAEIQTALPGGWRSKLPEGKLNYRPLKMTDKPFEVILRNGVVKDLLVEQEVLQWEANIIKSLVSQFQLDTRAENVISSRLNILPEQGSNSAVFKTIEDTVTGIAKTIYDIHPMPEFILLSEPHLAPFPHLKGDGSIIEIVKNKNFTGSHELPGYWSNLGSFGKWRPSANRVGYILHRNSLSRAVVTGSLQKYTIQYSETSNTIVVSSKKSEDGTVNSMMRIKLLNVEQASTQLPALSSPVNTGSLVYTYHKDGYEGRVSKGRTFEFREYKRKGDNSDENSQEYNANSQNKFMRSFSRKSDSSDDSMESQEEWTETKTKLSQAYQAPMLPLTMGYKGLSIRNAHGIDFVDKICRIAEKIASEFDEPQKIPQKQTLVRFITLTSIIRIMNEQELKQIANRLYTPGTKGLRYNTWVVFRDSVAETGTGPALMTFKHFIETNKVQGDEAGNLISTMARSVRQPTEEYLRAFFKLVVNQIDNQQDASSLNETMLLTFSEMAHNIIVNEKFSHREYPTHAYGKFYTSAGKSFIQDEVIPSFTENLNEAISHGYSRKIHAYIRALGEIGDPKIIHSFQPYLEGKKRCSQFQRLSMVVSLRKIMDVEAKTVGAILYRIYQNIGEMTEIRVAAIYMLMHTSPSAEMLQRIAIYTNFESNHRVCAAVKSAIQSAASLEGRSFAELRSAAESASKFLIKKDFGILDSQDSLKSHAFHNWESYYKYVFQTIVSEESGIPSSFYFAIEGEGNGYRTKTLSFESIVSDIRNFIHIFQKKTHWYREEQNKQHSSQQSESIWNSPKIARYLNLQTEELEQLEGIISLHLGELQKTFMFDNHTIESLPQYIQKLMSDWENGKKIEYTKIYNNHDGTLAYPTETGLPFLITYDVPVLVHFEGKMKAKAHPHVVSKSEFVLPDKIEMRGEFRLTISSKQQMKYGFFTPFNHHLYEVGQDDNVQLCLPVKVEAYIDFRNDKFHSEIEPIETGSNTNIFQLMSTPYISKRNILDLDAAAERKNVYIIRKNDPHQWESVVGDKSTGMAFRIKYENDKELTSIQDLFEEFFEIGVLYKHLYIEHVPELSKNKKIITDMVYKEEHQNHSDEQHGKAIIGEMSKLSSHQDQRVREIVRYASMGIQNARMGVFDSRVHFSGNESVEYVLTVSYARNQEDSKSCMLAYVKKHSNKSHSRPFAGALSVKFDMARVTGLDMNYIMNTDLQSFVFIDGGFSENLSTDNQFEIQAELKRSHARKQYLMQQPFYHRCQEETQQGNKQLLACANITQMAGLLDSISIKMKHPKLTSKDLNMVLSSYNSFMPQHPFEIENKQHKHKLGEMSLEVLYSPDLQKVSVSVSSRDIHAYMNNEKIYPWARPIIIPHPLFNVVDRLAGKLYSLQTYKPICTMDKTEAYTFDGSEYPLTLNDYWTVLMQYVPLRSSGDSYSSVEEQLEHELENYVILVKRSSPGSDKKDVKIVVSTPKTRGKVVEINLKSNGSDEFPQVFVGSKEVTVKQNGESETYNNQVTILGLPNREVYVRIHDDFYVIYDGTRVKVTSLGIKLRNRIRGLCGNFNSYRSDDFTTSSNCVVRDPKELIASYTVLREREYSPEVNEYKNKAQKIRCVHKKGPHYVNYISSHQELSQQSHQSNSSCMKYQTRYIVENEQICFTIRPLNVCSPECSGKNKVYKNVEVHCVQNKNIASLWKTQIDQGANPDFSQKPVTKTVELEVPHYCGSS